MNKYGRLSMLIILSGFNHNTFAMKRAYNHTSTGDQQQLTKAFNKSSDDLIDDCTREIIYLLEPSDLSHLALVSRRFNSLVNDPHVHKHYIHLQTPFNTLEQITRQIKTATSKSYLTVNRAIIKAIKEKDAEDVKLLLTHPLIDNLFSTKNKTTALHAAAQIFNENSCQSLEEIVSENPNCGGKPKNRTIEELILQSIIDTRPNFNAQNKYGQTALMVNPHTIVQKLLIPHTRLDIKDKHGATALYLAALSCEVDIIQLYLNHGANIYEKLLIKATPKKNFTTITPTSPANKLAIRFQGNDAVLKQLKIQNVEVAINQKKRPVARRLNFFIHE